MANDGMLLNFDLGGGPVKSQVKFTGGRWRDRIRASKREKRRQNDESTHPANAPKHAPTSKPVDRFAKFDNSERPAKRQRLGPSTEGHASKFSAGNQYRQQGGGPNSNPRGVTSRLFTANPAPKTAFEEVQAEEVQKEEASPVEPSNAPLSEEAANFHALGLSPRMSSHLSTKLGMKAPTLIQKNAIPQLINNDNDAFLQAETGSGKTLAYLLPMVDRIMALSQHAQGSEKATKIHRGSGLFGVILAPTRELCKQIATVAEKVLRGTPWIVSTTVMGGESKKSEKARIRKGVNILIATPGRLTDHLDHTKVLDLGTVRWLVLDEGDRLMEMGFEEDIRTIVAAMRKEELNLTTTNGVVLGGSMPSRRVTVLCSATMKMNVQKLGEISLQDASHITAQATNSEETTAPENEGVFTAPSQLKQSRIIVPAKLRLVTLIALLKSVFARKGSVMKAIVFISCADSVDFHFDLLKAMDQTEADSADEPDTKEKKPSATALTVARAAYLTSPANPQITVCKLHGSLQQPVRTATLASFTTSTDPAVLITTDISSRGLDVPAVDLVIEYDPAFSVADHVHRIGRTARAGRPGKAVLFLQPGCEEGYMTLLHSASAITPELYDVTLQKGLAAPVDLPKPNLDSSSDVEITAPQPAKQSWTARAEALQLHIEQRLLAPSPSPPADTRSRGHAKPKDSKILDSARRAFRSHIRAYATHVREERAFFDITQLHLGHMAKSFGLREAPGGIGGGVQRRTYKAPSTGAGVGKRRGSDSDGGGGDGSKSAVDEDAVRRMRDKVKAVTMSAAAEFNIG